MTDFDELLQRASTGEAHAREQVAHQLYDELRALAKKEMARERPDHTLQPTALVHEAWLRLVGDGAGDGSFANRAHFWSAAARAIRRILVEHARRRGRDKRGGGRQRVDVDLALAPDAGRDARLVALDEALGRLETLDADLARLVELRFFGGMTLDEAGAALGSSQSTVVRQWRVARAFLQSALDEDPAADGS